MKLSRPLLIICSNYALYKKKNVKKKWDFDQKVDLGNNCSAACFHLINISKMLQAGSDKRINK